MKYVVNAAQMQAADNYTSQKTGIPSLVLMERAALTVAEEVEAVCQTIQSGKRICIVCGSGNNGGDGFALGRILHERGYVVHFFMAEESRHVSESNLLQQKIARNLNLNVFTGKPVEEYDIVVDALFGTGLKREITGVYKDIICCLNAMKGYKVAVDIPSGINSDDGSILGEAFCADSTVTFAFYKWGQLLYPGKQYCGKVICRDIGIGEQSLCTNMPYGYMMEQDDIWKYLPKRISDSHKGTYGKAGIIAGSEDIGGAVILSATAAMNMGVGYTKVLTHKTNREALLMHLPEALIYKRNADTLDWDALKDCQAVAMGPGMGCDEASMQLLSHVLENYDTNLVLDADAITMLSQNPDLNEKCRNYCKNKALTGKRVVLTPHKKEFCRFAGISMDSKMEQFHKKAVELTKDYGMILVLKDAVTRIYTPEGRVYVNTTGNPGMSTAGSGDVLTGIICGLAAQMKDTVMATVLGVYLHGACGDYASAKSNPYSMKAMDMADALKSVLKGDA